MAIPCNCNVCLIGVAQSCVTWLLGFAHDVCLPFLERVAGRICERKAASHVTRCLHSCATTARVELFTAPSLATDVVKTPLAELLAGTHIRQEFFDALSVDCDRLVDEATRDAKAFIRKTPVFFFGLTGAGKSSLGNALLERIAGQPLDGKDRFPVEHDSRGTVGVDFRSVSTNDWATPGYEEMLIALDTQGWELKDVTASSKLLHQALQKAEDRDVNIQREVLKHRLIFVLVAHMETLKRDFAQREFKNLVLDICKQGKHMAGDCKPVLVPLFSKSDLEKDTSMRARLGGKAKAQLEEMRQFLSVEEPIFVSTLPTCSEGIDELIARIRQISKDQLRSEDILEQVRSIIERDCKSALQRIQSDGLHAESMLVRRHVWAAARARRLLVKGLFETAPSSSWRDADSLCAKMKKRKHFKEYRGMKAPHTDPTRAQFHGPEWRDSVLRKLSTSSECGRPAQDVQATAQVYLSPRGSEDDPGYMK
eukprot:TRINITY_DN26731_c0_g1_i1.p1 TRINITY_DN26731_c0_g1~~TRINITY_DN26731_c0_g1_i1.p1  ORF type:complete len:481 (-),score=63.42 TRINITY_DN26731_c0_g1_i1:260-1702(-)